MDRQPGVFDLHEWHRKLSKVDDSPTRLKELIDF